MKGVCIGVLAYTLLGVCLFSTATYALDAEYHEPQGSFSGDLFRAEWKRGEHSVFSPDLLMYIESVTSERLTVKLGWDPVVCGEQSMELSNRSQAFWWRLYSNWGQRSILRYEGDWDAFMFPIGMTIRKEKTTPPKDVQCVAKIIVTTTLVVSDKEKSDRLTLLIPIARPQYDADQNVPDDPPLRDSDLMQSQKDPTSR